MTKQPSIKLIINADDYAYFPCVSQGILQAASAGKLTATGILANSPDLTKQLAWLDKLEQIDLGVHLNLSYGQPLTSVMTEKLGQFSGVYPIVRWLITGKITVKEVKAEWRAQIEACLPRKLVFLNSHEHIHMLPILFPVVLALAADYNISFVRLTQPEWLKPIKANSFIRNSLIQCMSSINQYRLKSAQPIFLGLNQSGQLNLDYLSQIFSRLKAGHHYELMCHPGYFNETDICDPRLIQYHHWEQELALLLSPELTHLYEKFNITLGHYSH